MEKFNVRNFSIVLLVVFYLFALAIASNFKNDPDWKAFKCKYSKSYPCAHTEAEAYRNFVINKNKIAIRNLMYALNCTTYFSGLNENSDIDEKTWIKATSGFIPTPLTVNCTCTARRSRMRRGPLPASVDWHKSGLTTSVKNQGSCGSCYSFATAAAIEGQAIKHFGIRADLSNQQIIDCSGQNTAYRNLGCEGGFPSAAFDYVRDAGGLTSFSAYPYTAQVGFCYPANPLVPVLGHKRYTQTSDEQLKQILASVGPVVVAMAVDVELNHYKKGIFTSPKCRSTQMNQLDHTVTLVGYGAENGVNYWKIKNSWGPSWGEGGYVRINRDYDCGVKLDVYAPSS